MPVQNSYSKISARPDLTTNPLQILIPTTFNSLLCQKRQFTLQQYIKRWFDKKILGYYPQKIKIENSLEKFLPVQKGGFQETTCPKDRQDGVLAKFLSRT